MTICCVNEWLMGSHRPLRAAGADLRAAAAASLRAARLAAAALVGAVATVDDSVTHQRGVHTLLTAALELVGGAGRPPACTHTFNTDMLDVCSCCSKSFLTQLKSVSLSFYLLKHLMKVFYNNY